MFEKEKEAFEELNRRLRQKEMNLTVICAGGYVLSRHGMRTTQDTNNLTTPNSGKGDEVGKWNETLVITGGTGSFATA